MHHPYAYPFIVVDNSLGEHDGLMDMVHTMFEQVVTVSSRGSLVDNLRHEISHLAARSSIVLINGDDDDCLDSLSAIANAFPNMAPIVYSWSDSPEFMVQCLQHGAVDYILKPLRHDVAKTLFLNVHRLQGGHKCSNTRRVGIPAVRTGDTWMQFQDRLKGVFLTENWLPKTVAEYYTPKPSARRSSMSSKTSDHKQYLKSRVCSWDFLPLEMDEHDLVLCVYLIFEQVFSLPEMAKFRTSKSDLLNFIFDVCDLYHRNNPYHNFYHAVDVLQAAYYFLCRSGVIPFLDDPSATPPSPPARLKTLLRPLDILALFMACIGHDAGHPGVSNIFMVNTVTPLAILYNDRSVLESFHCMAFFNLFHRHYFGNLSEMPASAEYTNFRKTIVHCILATDMSFHDDYVQKLRQLSAELDTTSPASSDADACDQERLTLCAAIIKCADISNCARPFPVAKRWATILAEEFSLQGDLERELGVQVAPINDRGKLALEDTQLAFKENIAVKLFEAVAEPLPEMAFCIDHIKENIHQWKRLKESRLDSGVGASPGTSVQTSNQKDDTGEHVHSSPLDVNSSQDEPYILSPSAYNTNRSAKHYMRHKSSLHSFPSRLMRPGSSQRRFTQENSSSLCQCNIQ